MAALFQGMGNPGIHRRGNGVSDTLLPGRDSDMLFVCGSPWIRDVLLRSMDHDDKYAGSRCWTDHQKYI